MAVPSILLFCDYYLPGFKAGGGLRTAVNLVEQLSDEFRFRIVTRDRDLGDTTPYPGCGDLRWRSVGPAQVLYLPPQLIHSRMLRHLIRTTEHDVRMFNSIFSTLTVRSLTLQRFGCIPACPTIVAPRGEFTPGALSQKAWKKSVFLRAARWSGLYRDVTFLATNVQEQAAIREQFGATAQVGIAPDLLTRAPRGIEQEHRSPKCAGRLRVMFLSRISPMKNLEEALRLVSELRGEIDFEIIGPCEDAAYWSRCQAQIAALPDHVRVTCRGPVSPADVTRTLTTADVFLLPTLGENFGYVILEALQAGCPVVISDRTPWRGLAEAGVGYDLPLSEPDRFRHALQSYVDMDAQQFAAITDRARTFADEFCRTSKALQQNLALVAHAASRAVPGSANRRAA